MHQRLDYYIICVVFLGSIVQCEHQFGVSPADDAARFIFAFGDSYTSTNYTWTAPEQPSAEDPFGNPIDLDSYTVGGPNWLTVLVDDFAPWDTLCYNYAVMGALVDNTIIPQDIPVPSFVQQIDEFLLSVGATSVPLSPQSPPPALAPTAYHVPWNSTNSIFTIWFGINDVSEILGIPFETEETRIALYHGVTAVYVQQMKRLWDAGARRFVVILVSPFDRAPGSVVNAPYAIPETSRAIKDFNAILSRAAHDSLTASGNGVTYHIHDPTPLFDRFLNDPRRYGAPNATCMDWGGRICLWHDVLHPGIAVHRELGKELGAVFGKLGFF